MSPRINVKCEQLKSSANFTLRFFILWVYLVKTISKIRLRMVCSFCRRSETFVYQEYPHLENTASLHGNTEMLNIFVKGSGSKNSHSLQ
jgi:hypothetical protein